MENATTEIPMLPITITRRIEWDAAHRVMRHESKCATLHGHRYVALVTATATKLDDCDRVVDFGVIKERVGKWVDDNWDHTTLVNSQDHQLFAFAFAQADARNQRLPYQFDAEPTAETIAATLLRIASELLFDTGVKVTSVEVFETPNCSAKAVAP